MSSNPHGGAGGNAGPAGDIVPDQHAMELADQLVDSPLNGTVLHETLTAAENGSITESGRTVCSTLDNVSGPIARHPMAVDLPGCRPWDATGIIHSHVTPDEIRNPIHSLPDIANVLYGNATASVIPGTETTHVVVRPTDATMAEARAAFDNVLGVDVDDPEDVSRAVDEGAIVSLDSAQERILTELGPIVDRVEYPRPEAAVKLEELPLDEDQPAMVASELAFMDDEPQPEPRPTEERIEPKPSHFRAVERHREIATHVRQMGDGDTSDFIRATIISNVVGTIVGGVVSRAVFGD